MSAPDVPVVQAEACGHAGEILQGAVRVDGRVKRFLVSLPAPQLRSHAVLCVRPGVGLRVFPQWKHKSMVAAQAALQAFGESRLSGDLVITSNIPPCRGLGSSTSDCVAAIRAVAAACGVQASPDRIAALAHEAELSSDGTMYGDNIVAFLHCEGRVLRHLRGSLMPIDLLIVDTDPGSDGVATDDIARPRYMASELEQFELLMNRLESLSVSEIGAVATASASINQGYCPKVHFDCVMRVADDTGALGVAAAHSGTVLTLLYQPGGKGLGEARRRLTACGLTAGAASAIPQSTLLPTRL